MRSFVLWRGETCLPGQRGEVAAIVSFNTRNRKTGDEAQVWYVPVTEGDVTKAVAEGRDAAVCGQCPQRPVAGGACYVVHRWGPAVCIVVEPAYVGYRYEAVRIVDQATIWVANGDSPDAVSFIRPADDVSRRVLTLTGPYGGGSRSSS